MAICGGRAIGLTATWVEAVMNSSHMKKFHGDTLMLSSWYNFNS